MTAPTATRPSPQPMILPCRSLGDQILVKVFVLIPFAALIAAVPIAWGWGLGWTDLVLASTFYVVACLGVIEVLHGPSWLPGAMLALLTVIGALAGTLAVRVTRRLWRTTAMSYAAGL